MGRAADGLTLRDTLPRMRGLRRARHVDHDLAERAAYEMRERGRRIVECIRALDVVPLGAPVEDAPITALWPRSRTLAPKVRVVVDALVDAFRLVPPWDLNWPTPNHTHHC